MNNDSIILTVLFEGWGLNRDEKSSKNELTVKIIERENEKYSVISRDAMRHYLFNTLNRIDENEWKVTDVCNKAGVIQLDLEKFDILNSAELDAFGYMYTIENDISFNRAAPIGLTKATSVYPIKIGTFFHSNPGMAKRLPFTTQSIWLKEEVNALYKFSLVIDTKTFGEDVMFVNEVEYNNGTLILKKIPTQKDDKDKQDTNTVSQNNENNIEKDQDKVENKATDKDKKNSKQKKPFIKIIQNVSQIQSSETEQKYRVYLNNAEIGEITVIKRRVDVHEVRFKLSEVLKRKRIYQILNTFNTGWYARSSGEVNTIVPLCVIAKFSKVPCPALLPHIVVNKKDDVYIVKGLKEMELNDCIYIKESYKMKVDKEGLVNVKTFNELLNLYTGE